MAALWHILFPPNAEVTAPDHTVKDTIDSHCCASSSSNGPPVGQLPAISAAGSSARDAHGCCKSSASPHASCSQASPTEARGLPNCSIASQHPGSEEAKGQHVHPLSSSTMGKILYASQKGTAASYAHQLARAAASAGLVLTVADVAQYEVEQMWKEQCVILVLSTYQDGTPPSSAK